MASITRFRQEIDSLAGVIEDADKHAVVELTRSVEAASTASILGVGSGGSFSAATFLCHLHEVFTGRLSRPATPLEIICNPTLAAESPVFLISSEGKNPDAVEALMRARSWSARSVHVITNRDASPLMAEAGAHTDIRSHVFKLSEKDGYLATRSLILNSIQIARCYLELNGTDSKVPQSLRAISDPDSIARSWLKDQELLNVIAGRQSVIVVHSPLLRPIAVDLESKLAESALLHCQLADLRSFAHGRHLWLANRSADTAIVALIEPSLQNLWEQTKNLLPRSFPILSLMLPDSSPWSLISGIVGQMYFVDAIAQRKTFDPGSPPLGEFARDLHYMPLSSVLPQVAIPSEIGEITKRQALGWQWPARSRSGAMGRALKTFIASLHKHSFRGIVFDYDGTLCPTNRRTEPLAEPIVGHLRRLSEHGVFIGIASGRGGSIAEALRSSIPSSLWPQFIVGLYNGGYASALDEAVENVPLRPAYDEFLGHVTRILRRLMDLGVPIDQVRTTHPYQVSIRFKEGVSTDQMWFVIADFLRQEGIHQSRIVRSGHSIDVLADGVSKSRLIAGMIEKYRLGPYELLTLGDKGAWPGNDFDILEHKYSLSVDAPSRRLDRGWNLAPTYKRFVDATLWYLERFELVDGGKFEVNIQDLLAKQVSV